MSQRITLQTNLSADSSGLKDVSLLTTGIEAAGHGLYLDEKTAEGAMKLLLGRSVKSYLRHESACGDRLGQEIGFFSGIYRAGAQIKATAFEFLDSFKKEAAATAEKLLELAQKVPDQFGVSLVAEYLPVWVLADGTELEARLGEATPAGAVRPLPAMRIIDILSADFVGRPAANPAGLFSKDAPVDGAASKQTTTTTISPMSESAAILTPPASAPVATLSLTDHEAKIAELAVSHQAALAAALANLKAEKDEIAKQVTALNAALADKEGAHTAALEKAKAEATAPLAAKIKELEAYDARKLGVPPLKIAQLQFNATSAALATPEEKLAHYEKLETGQEKTAFRKKHYAELMAAEDTRASKK